MLLVRSLCSKDSDKDLVVNGNLNNFFSTPGNLVDSGLGSLDIEYWGG